MPLAPGTRLGPYEILAAIGAGGMGEVYRARDTKLDREVAVKVLPAALAQDPERLLRFEREAKVLASLKHPNIAQIYGVEDRALIMELVDGEAPKGPLPLETALNYARQIAEALEAAHEKGIVHRDLKPANVKVTPEGLVKVLDFGLAAVAPASAVDSNPTDSPTLTMAATQVGVIMGTAAYMSPEQASGRPADKRADIWSFGVVLCELLTGRRLFDGETVSHTLADVLRGPIDFDQLPRETPAAIRGLLRRCLDRNVKNRLRDIGEARIAIEAVLAGETAPGAPESAPSRSRLGIAGWIVAAVIAAISLWGWLRPAPPTARTVTHFTIALPEGTGPITNMAVSRDGSRFAFVGGLRREIYVRMMDQLDARLIPGTEGARVLSFSPDGQWISYIDSATPTQLRKVPVAGGPSLVLAEAAAEVGPPVPNWGDDGNILFGSKGVLLRVPSGGGQAQILAIPDAKIGERSYFAPQLLPGGRNVLVTVSKKSGLATAVLNLQTGEKRIVIERNALAQFANTDPSSAMGHIVYYDAATGSLMAAPFDANRLQVKGSPVPVLDGVQSIGGPFGSFGFSDAGTLAYVTGAGPELGNNTLAWVDLKGAEQPLPAPARLYKAPAVSPDGELVAVQLDQRSSPLTLISDIWLYSLARRTLTRLTSEDLNFAPVWTTDAKLIYTSYSDTARDYGLRSTPADGSGSAKAVSARQPHVLYIGSVSPDGKLAIGFSGSQPEGRAGLQRFGMWLLSLAAGASADAKLQPFSDSRFSKIRPQFSPDGRWVAYQSDDTGRNEIYVTPYPGPGERVPVSNEGGTEPRWARNGRELFYRNGDKMIAVDIQTAPAFRAGAPRLLFEGHYYFAESAVGRYSWSYDVAPDGKRFLMLKPAARQNAGSGQLHVVVNWFEELRRRVPVGK